MTAIVANVTVWSNKAIDADTRVLACLLCAGHFYSRALPFLLGGPMVGKVESTGAGELNESLQLQAMLLCMKTTFHRNCRSAT